MPFSARPLAIPSAPRHSRDTDDASTKWTTKDSGHASFVVLSAEKTVE